MRIAVMSPGRRQGSTTVSILLADMLSRFLDSFVYLTSTSSNNSSINRYLNVLASSDQTTSITQVVKMLEVNAMSKDDIPDYTIKRGDKFGLFDTNNDMLTQEDIDSLYTFVLKNLDRDIGITDVTDELYDDRVQEILENSDIFIIVITQSEDVLDTYFNWRMSEYYKKFEKKPVITVVNMFNDNVGALRPLAKRIRTKKSSVQKLTYNPFIMKMANSGELNRLGDYLLDGDVRVANIKTDLQELVNLIALNAGSRPPWRG